MNIRQLECFLSVCETQSFTKTAQALYMTQQGVSKIVAGLEKDLGFLLFYRTPSGLRITEYGRLLQQSGGDIVGRYQSMMEAFSRLREDDAGEIHFGMMMGAVRYITFDLLSDFRMRFPNIRLLEQEMLNIECEQRVWDETLDLAVSLGPMDEQRFDSIPMKSHSMLTILRRDHPLAQKERLTLSDLDGYSIIGNRGKQRMNLERLCRKEGFSPNIVFESGEPTTKLALCEQYGHVAFSVDFVLSGMRIPGTLCLRPLVGDVYRWNMCLFTKKGRKISRPCSLLIDFLKREIIESPSSERRA